MGPCSSSLSISQHVDIALSKIENVKIVFFGANDSFFLQYKSGIDVEGNGRGGSGQHVK